MKTTGFKGVLSFVVAVAVTAAMAYSAVTVVEKNNAAMELERVKRKLRKRLPRKLRQLVQRFPQTVLKMENTKVLQPVMVVPLLFASPSRVES